MAWVIDTCLFIDVALADPIFAKSSATLIDSKKQAGLIICPVSFVELAPVFGGNSSAQIQFLLDLGVRWPEPWTDSDTIALIKPGRLMPQQSG